MIDHKKEYLKQVGERIETKMKERGLSRKEMSEYLEITPSTLGRYINGSSEMNGFIFTKLLQVLNCKAKDLL